jgi:hypothetical protein
MATSLALKCAASKPLLDDLEKALEKLELQADDSLSKMRENDPPIVSNDCCMETVNSTILFRVPQVVKGAKSKRAKSVVEKQTRKKKKGSQEKGTHAINYTTFCLLMHILIYYYHVIFLIVSNIFIML